MFSLKNNWMAISLYVNAVAAGIILYWIFSPTKETDTTLSTKERVESILRDEESNEQLPLRFTISNGDQLFRIGEYDRAILHYRSAVDQPQNEAVLYRIGLALEAARRFSKAEKTYRILAENTRRNYFKRAATLGLGRIFVRTNREHQGQSILLKLVLHRPSKPESKDKQSNAQLPNRSVPGKQASKAPETKELNWTGIAAHLVAMSYANKLIQPNSEITTDIDTAVHADVSFDPHHYHENLLAVIGEANPFDKIRSRPDEPILENEEIVREGDEVTFGPHGYLAIKSLGPAIDLSGQQILIRSNRVGLVELLSSIEQTLNCRIVFTDSALATAKNHAPILSIDQIDVGTLLHAILSPMDLHWMEVDGVIQIAASSELEKDERELLAYRRSVHLLRYCIFDFPDIRLLPGTQFVFGNLAFQKREWSTAVANYREVIRARYLTPFIRQRASFNLGKCFLQIGELEEAEKAMFFAIDDAESGDLVAAGLIILAQQKVYADQLREAEKLASRAAAAAKTNGFRELATLVLSCTYVLDKKFYAANQALVDYRDSFETPDFIAVAAFLSAHSRFFGQTSHSNEELNDLIRTLGTPFQFRDLPHLPLLVATAKHETGFQSDALRILLDDYTKQRATKLRARIRDELSRWLLSSATKVESLEVYEKVLATDAGENSTNTQLFRSAQLHFHMNKFESCKRICQQILDRKSIPEVRDAVLNLMGQAYERTGDYHTAATFYAGVSEDAN